MEILYSPLTTYSKPGTDFVHADSFAVLVDFDEVRGFVSIWGWCWQCHW